MKVILLGTMQLCSNNIHVNDKPKSMVPDPTDNQNALGLSRMGTDEEMLKIPL